MTAVAVSMLLGIAIKALLVPAVAYVFTKGAPVLLSHVKSIRLRGWLTIVDQIVGGVVLTLLPQALDAAQGASANGPKAAGQAAFDVLETGFKARLGPSLWGDMQKHFGDAMDAFLQHALVGAATNPPDQANGDQVAKAAQLAAHLNALTA